MSADNTPAIIAAISGIVGVILGFILNIVKDLIFQNLIDRSNGRFASAKIISVLEEYADACIEVVYDDGTSEGQPAGRTEQGEEYHESQIDCPNPPSYPRNIDWRTIPYTLMYRILALPNTARETDRFIAHSGEHSFPPDYEEYFSARQEGYAHLGLEALSLMSDLRQEFGFPALPAKPWDWGWDGKTFLQEKLKEFAERRQKQEKANAAEIAEVKGVRETTND